MLKFPGRYIRQVIGQKNSVPSAECTIQTSGLKLYLSAAIMMMSMLVGTMYTN